MEPQPQRHRHGAQSGLCLDVTAKGTTDGTLVELWTCNSGTDQQWTLS